MENSVLVIDSDQFITRMISDVLLDEGFFVSSYNDTSAALQSFSMDYKSINCVILDILSQNFNNDELISELRARKSKIPIILMSSELPEELFTVLKIFHDIYYLKKPFHIDEIVNVVKSALRKKNEI